MTFKHLLTKTLLVVALLGVGMGAWAQTAPTVGVEATTGDFYIYNLATGKYLSKGVAFGTHADVDAAGSIITISGEANAYILHFDGCAEGTGLGTDAYVDKASNDELFTTWSFESAGDISGYSNVYKIKAANNAYLHWANSYGYPWCNETWLTADYDFSGANANYGYWILIPKATRQEYKSATVSTPVDATWRMKDPDFEGYNPSAGEVSTIWDGDFIMNSYTKSPYSGMFYEKWAGEVESTSNEMGTKANNGNYHLKDFKEYQTISNLRPGIYRLSVSAEAVQQGATAEELTGYYLYATEVNYPENTEQKEITTMGTYSVEFCVISSGAVFEIGVKTESTTANWVSVDNFRLTFVEPYIGEIAEPLTSGGTMEAGKWYTIGLAGSRDINFEAGSAIEDIVYVDSDMPLSWAEGMIQQLPTSLRNDEIEYGETLSYWFKSSSTQTLTYSVQKETGDETVVADIDFSNPIVNNIVQGSVNSMTIANRSDYPNIISDENTALENSYKPGTGALVVGMGNWNADLGYNIVGTVDIAETNRAGYAHISENKNNDIVTITFKMAFGNLSQKYAGFSLRDATGTEIAGLQYCRYNNLGNNASTPFGTNTFGLTTSDLYADNKINQARTQAYNEFVVTLDYKNGTMSCKTQQMDVEKTVTMSNKKPFAQFLIISNYNNLNRRSLFDNLVITNTEGDYTVSTSNYTVKYVCNDVDVKEADTRTGDVNSVITLRASDKANFFNNDETKRYIYVSDDAEGKTVAQDGSTVVTVTFREAVKWNYTVTSSYTVAETKNMLDWSTSGEVWEDLNTVTIQYPRYQVFNTTELVGRSPVNNNLQKSITVTEDGYTEDLNYAVTDITNLYLLAEAESLGVGTQANTSFSSRVSGGKIIYGASGTLLTLPAGKYIFTLGAIGGSNAQQNTFVVKAGETTIAEGTCTGNFLSLYTGDEFTLTDDTEITFTSSNPNSDRGIDLIYIQKTAEMPTIGSTGYATFASDYDLGFYSNTAYGVEAYYAYAAADGKVTMNRVLSGTNLTPGTGLLLQKVGDDDVSIGVMTGMFVSTSYPNNLLHRGPGESEPIKSNEEADVYVLANQNGDVAFYRVPETGEGVIVPTDKAYLSIPKNVTNESQSRLAIVFDDDATAIDAARLVNSEESTVKSEIYNLQGQRVSQPSKGLYIVNGKKVIMK